MRFFVGVFAGVMGVWAGGCASRPREMGPIDLERVPIVYGGGGSVRTVFRISQEQWREFEARFASGTASPGAERAAIRWSIGKMERIAGEQTITWMDKGMNGGRGLQGQLDCIDESTNTNVYLHLFEQRGLLKWHRVLWPVWRAPHLVDTHRTAVVRDTTDGRRYAVDSWFLDNGEPPFIQRLEEWMRRERFPEQE